MAPKPIATPPAAPSVDELIGQLEKLRQQKVELERQEKAVAEKLQERLRDQAGRLAKLGIVPPSKEEAKDVADGIMPLLQK